VPRPAIDELSAKSLLQDWYYSGENKHWRTTVFAMKRGNDGIRQDDRSHPDDGRAQTEYIDPRSPPSADGSMDREGRSVLDYAA
jgi:hypothetical protein